MKKNNHRLEKIAPFLILGVSLAIGIALMIMMFYVFVWGALIGLALWGIMMLKEKFFPSATSSTDSPLFSSWTSSFSTTQKDEGIVIDAEPVEPSKKTKKSATKK